MSEKIKKPFYKKWWVWLIAIIVVIAVVSGGDGDEDKAEEVSSEAAEEATEKSDKEDAEETEDDEGEDEAEEEEESFGIGDPAKVGDVIFTVNSAEETSEIESGNEFVDNATTSGKFVILNITVKNEKEDAITVDTSFFTLKDGDTTYDPTSDFEVMMALDEDDDFFLSKINPNLDLTGDIAIEVSDDLDLSTATLEAQTGFFGTETVNISLAE